ncbi:MAG: response regulator [Hyphomicrobiaceae bacterium]
MRILLIEDERELASDLSAALGSLGHVVEIASDGELGCSRGMADTFDLVILDLGLPGLPGKDIIKRWRANNRQMHVLVLTAHDGWSEKVEVMDLGADDYMTKPFHMGELLARVRALLRRLAPRK